MSENTSEKKSKRTTIWDLFETDPEKERNGVWIDFGNPETTGFKLLIARAGSHNERFNTRLRKLQEPYSRQIRNDTLDDETGRELLRKAYSDTVLLGWEKVVDKDGKEIPYNPTNALRLMREIPDFFDFVMNASTSMSHFRKDQIEENVKN